MANLYKAFDETVHGKRTIIKFTEDDITKKRQYYIYESIPWDIQRDPIALRKYVEDISRKNQENNTRKKVVSNIDPQGGKEWFVREPSSLVKAFIHSCKVDREVKRDQKILNEIKSGMIASKNKYKKTDGNLKVKLIALGLASTLAVGSIIGITALSDKGNDNQPANNSVISGQVESTPGYTSGFELPTTPEVSDSTVSPEVEEKVYTDLDTLTFDTYVSNGKTFVEVADMLKIAEACYDNLEIELENANHNYSFDVSKFEPEMYVGESIQECSLKYVVDYVNQYGCRGMFMIGADATKEANEVSRKLTGKDIILDSKQLDNPVDAMMTCMYISVRNFEYCADIVGAENVTPNMVYDCYLFGCGNVRKWLRACMVDGEYNGGYKPQTYSQKVLYYGECLESYNDALKKGLTNGEHDSYWQDLHVNKLWKLPDFESAQASEIERE